MPSLQTPCGPVAAPGSKEPSGVMSAAFHRETWLVAPFVIRTRCPSNATAVGSPSPLPVIVWSTAPVEARTTETEREPALGTQMFEPSNAGNLGTFPTVTVWRTTPAGSSLRSRPGVPACVTQMFPPSQRTPSVTGEKPDTEVTVQGSEAVGVTMLTWFVPLVQKRAPSKTVPVGNTPTADETVVTAPAACDGSMEYIVPGLVKPVMTTRPIAIVAQNAWAAPVHVSRSFPSLARTRLTVPGVELGTQTSAPSERGYCGLTPTVVSPRTVEFCVVQNWSRIARRLPRLRTPSTVRERNAAIWRRDTLDAGS